MKILLAHTRYQIAGGEDSVFEAEKNLLTDNGHTVVEFIKHNDSLNSLSKSEQLKATIWNQAVHDELKEILQRERPEVAHFHNTFPYMSASAYDACKSCDVPVVQTLHNFRLLCPNALFYRDAIVCEDCLTQTFKWPAILHNCYRGSKSASAATAWMLYKNRLAYREKVDAYITLTEFAKTKFIAGKIPAEKLHVKPNFQASDPGVGDGKSGFGVYVGRISEEKGPEILLAACSVRKSKNPIHIVGEGPLFVPLQEKYSKLENVVWHGKQPKEFVLDLLKKARYLVLPSVCYEGMPMTIVEALSCGTPVIVPELGALHEIPGAARLVFKPGNPASLAYALDQAAEKDIMDDLRPLARQHFLDHYTADANIAILESIYRSVMR